MENFSLVREFQQDFFNYKDFNNVKYKIEVKKKVKV